MTRSQRSSGQRHGGDDEQNKDWKHATQACSRRMYSNQMKFEFAALRRIFIEVYLVYKGRWNLLRFAE